MKDVILKVSYPNGFQGRQNLMPCNFLQTLLFEEAQIRPSLKTHQFVCVDIISSQDFFCYDTFSV